MLTNPSGTERLHQYWVHGAGAAKIRWGAPGDFDRCVEHLSKFIRDAKGYCNLAHHAALGIYPATHAAMEKKATGRSAMTVSERAEMTSASINDLPDSAFAYIEPGGKKDSSGKTVPRSLRHFPVHDAAHARNALARAPQSPFGDKAMPKIREAARKFGIDVSADSGSGRAESFAPYLRSFPIEDVSVKTTRDGRIVDAYLAVFNTSAPVHDQDGEYTEELDPAVFNKAISDAAPQGSRETWRTSVFYNHAMTIHGTPSEMFSIPIATTQSLAADGHGVRATDKYHRSQLSDEIVEGIESGAIPGYSFGGRFRRSSPLIPYGGFRKNHRTGELPHVRRLESTLKEYGPTPFPVYAGAAIQAVRSDSLMAAMLQDPELALRMIRMASGGAPGEPPPETGTPDLEPPPRSRLAHSGRSVKEEIDAQRAAFLLRSRRS